MRVKCSFCHNHCFLVNQEDKIYNRNILWDCYNHFDDVLLVRTEISVQPKKIIGKYEHRGDVRTLCNITVVWEYNDFLYRAEWVYNNNYNNDIINFYCWKYKPTNDLSRFGMDIDSYNKPILTLNKHPTHLTPENIKQKILTMVNFS